MDIKLLMPLIVKINENSNSGVICNNSIQVRFHLLCTSQKRLKEITKQIQKKKTISTYNNDLVKYNNLHYLLAKIIEILYFKYDSDPKIMT
jgi:hypothetical protein